MFVLIFYHLVRKHSTKQRYGLGSLKTSFPVVGSRSHSHLSLVRGVGAQHRFLVALMVKIKEYRGPGGGGDPRLQMAVLAVNACGYLL